MPLRCRALIAPRLHQAHRPCGVAQDGGGPLLELLSMPTASRRAFSFAAFSLVASLRRSAAPESQFVDDAAIARRDSDSLTLTGIPDAIPACSLTASIPSIKSSMVDVKCKCRSLLVKPRAVFLNSVKKSLETLRFMVGDSLQGFVREISQ